MHALGARARGPGTVFFTGGASAVLVGWRDSTVDIDVKLDPEPAGAFEAIARLKDELGVNVELAAPDQFLPELEGWRARSPFIERHGDVDFHHYDFEAQALCKIDRGWEQDLADAAAMVVRGLVAPARLAERLRLIEPDLVRYPAVDAAALRERVHAFVARHGAGDG
jgi:hypothetical protein